MSIDEMDLLTKADIEEILKRRFKDGFIAMWTSNDIKFPGKTDTAVMWDGNITHILGLIEYTKLRMIDWVNKGEPPDDDFLGGCNG